MISQIIFAVVVAMAINSQLVSSTGDPILLGKVINTAASVARLVPPKIQKSSRDRKSVHFFLSPSSVDQKSVESGKIRRPGNTEQLNLISLVSYSEFTWQILNNSVCMRYYEKPVNYIYFFHLQCLE